ncbi:C2 domain-containing protein 5 [Hondaea fermentalgiana]|uniref:C2 domain-containing protein 5 n=1 Tax=Hondaea fermentalgiana TaxID=2315210 RepID=A0A2R5GLP3_9STRA|nr:C2 domain-containing protein 5 [Hondaea fermentalgiana]|eukprot:GBG29201.1 C2 domain-containing protein 5 [Hondaea fermentalgiana]
MRPLQTCVLYRADFAGKSHGVLVEARICRVRPKLNSKAESREVDASAVSENLIFLEIELHKQLMLKLKLMGMNAAFGLRSQVQIGSSLMIGVTTATAVHSPALPPPAVLRIHRSLEVEDQDDRKHVRIQKEIERIAAANRDRMLTMATSEARLYRQAIATAKRRMKRATRATRRRWQQEYLLEARKRRARKRQRKRRKRGREAAYRLSRRSRESGRSADAVVDEHLTVDVIPLGGFRTGESGMDTDDPTYSSSIRETEGAEGDAAEDDLEAHHSDAKSSSGAHRHAKLAADAGKDGLDVIDAGTGGDTENASFALAAKTMFAPSKWNGAKRQRELDEFFASAFKSWVGG